MTLGRSTERTGRASVQPDRSRLNVLERHAAGFLGAGDAVA